MKTPPPLEAFSFTLSAHHAESVYELISRHGFPKTCDGVKEFLLQTANRKAEPYTAPEQKPETESYTVEDEPELGEGLRKILEAVRRNPEVMDFAKKKGAVITRSLFRHLFA
jgi:hypothetical protein